MTDAKQSDAVGGETNGARSTAIRVPTLFEENTAQSAVQSPVNDGQSQASILDRALEYQQRGFAVIEVPFGAKAPNRKGWQHETHDEQSIRASFGTGRHNIGVILGSRSRGLIDCDQDQILLTEIINWFLPDTPARFGRASKPNGHRLYICDPMPKSEKFVDPIPVAEGGMGTIGEIRGEGLQTIFPGSFHRASGEIVEWEGYGEPATVDGAVLREAYALACAFALLKHHFPGEGARHDAALALAGGLMRHGWE